MTNVARKKLVDLIDKSGKSAYLYLKGGGCNGFSFKFKILKEDEKPHKLDEQYDVDGYNLYLCNKSLLHLIGTNIDYIEDIMGSRFDFNNEKIQSKCGCGTSFTMKDV